MSRYQQLREKLLDFDNLVENLDAAEKFAAEAIGSRTTNSQIRKYYDYLISLKRKLKSGTAEETVKIELKLLKARLAYAVNRSQASISKEFKFFIDDAVDKLVKSDNFPEVYEKFLKVMEAIVGYHRTVSSK